MCVCVCVREREREERGGGERTNFDIDILACFNEGHESDVISYSIQSAAHPLLAQCATWLA